MNYTYSRTSIPCQTNWIFSEQKHLFLEWNRIHCIFVLQVPCFAVILFSAGTARNLDFKEKKRIWGTVSSFTFVKHTRAINYVFCITNCCTIWTAMRFHWRRRFESNTLLAGALPLLAFIFLPVVYCNFATKFSVNLILNNPKNLCFY